MRDAGRAAGGGAAGMRRRARRRRAGDRGHARRGPRAAHFTFAPASLIHPR